MMKRIEKVQKLCVHCTRLLHVLPCKVMLWFPTYTSIRSMTCMRTGSSFYNCLWIPNAESANIGQCRIDMHWHDSSSECSDLRARPDGQTLRCCVLFERFWAVFPANAALAKATPWTGWIISMMAVYLGASNERGTNYSKWAQHETAQNIQYQAVSYHIIWNMYLKK